jgi:hypothetical protein
MNVRLLAVTHGWLLAATALAYADDFAKMPNVDILPPGTVKRQA